MDASCTTVLHMLRCWNWSGIPDQFQHLHINSWCLLLIWTLHSLTIFSLLHLLGIKFRGSSPHMWRKGRVLCSSRWRELTKIVGGWLDLHWPSVDLFWVRFWVEDFCLGMLQFWAQNPRQFDLYLTSVDCARVCCTVDFRWPVWLEFFRLFLG